MGNVPSANHHIKWHTLDLCSTMQCYQSMRSWYSLTWWGFLTMKFKRGEGFLSMLSQQFLPSIYPSEDMPWQKHIHHADNTIHNPTTYHCLSVKKMSYYLHYGAAPRYKKHGSISTCYNSSELVELCLVKAANHKCQHTTWFCFHEVSRMNKSTAWKATNVVYSCIG